MSWLCYLLFFGIGVCVGCLAMRFAMDGDLNRYRMLQTTHSQLEIDKEQVDRINNRYIDIIKDMIDKWEAEPKDCKRGPWCHNCQYVEYYSRYVSMDRPYIRTFYCGKNKACKNYVEMKADE